MKTTTKTRATKKNNPHAAANAALDAMMSEADRAYWAEAARNEKEAAAYGAW